MKVILSRKGFDSSAGGHASPILPDGTMLSLPIPSSHDALTYDSIKTPDGRTCADVLADLGGKARVGGKGAHLDPDLLRASRPRFTGWRPSLGQINAAAGHLRNQGIGQGDLFLFYGWFRPTEWVAGKLRFTGPREGFHAIFGYLQVDDILRPGSVDEVPGWLADHPHCVETRVGNPTNAIYISKPVLSWDPRAPGAGTFHFAPPLILSKSGMSRSCWALDPGIFGNVEISYHSREAWRDGYFKSYPRAQEYVIAPDERVTGWARALIRKAVSQTTNEFQEWSVQMSGATLG